jgi:hypothetical protein
MAFEQRFTSTETEVVRETSMLVFCCSAQAGVVREEIAPPAPTGLEVAAELFDDDTIPELDVELSPTAIAMLRESPYTAVEGALVYRGVRFEPVAVKLTSSLMSIDEKPSIRVDLDHYAPLELLGLHALELEGMANDPTMMAERIAYRLFREHGIPASRANHAAVWIGGEDRGLYALIEPVDDDFLAARGTTGALWSLDDADFDEDGLAGFEPVSGTPDPAVLEAVAEALATGASTDPWIDWAEFLAFAAGTVVTGHYDGYPWSPKGDDAYLWLDPVDGRLDMIPSRLDETFRDPLRDPLAPAGLLLLACLDAPDCAADFVAAIWAAQDTAERIDLSGYVLDVQAQIAPLVAADPARPYTLDEVALAQAELLAFVDGRREQLTALLGGL